MMSQSSRRSGISTIIALGLAIAVVSFTRWRLKGEKKRRKKTKKDRNVNIGAIFGMDVGGTLAKIVFFEKDIIPDSPPPSDAASNSSKDSNSPLSSPREVSSRGLINDIEGIVNHTKLRRNSRSLDHLNNPDHKEALQRLYSLMESSEKNGNGGMYRDEFLSFYSDALGGKLHFLRFETKNMIPIMDFIASTSMTENIHTMGCTGGGAHKYAKEFSERLDITLQQTDEFSSLIRGMHFAITQAVEECYTYRHFGTDNMFSKPTGISGKSNLGNGQTKSGKSLWNRDVKEFMREVQFSGFEKTQEFPYLVVNIGSGVSILKVTGPGTFERVSGTSLGGGTYWGLCRLLTRCSSYEEVLSKAELGDNTEIDMLVRDIYGGDYENMNLSATMVASSFGKLVMKDLPKEGLKDEDVAIALLMMITNNIGQVAYLCAQLHGCSKIFFVGSFLRRNKISCRRLAFAINFWSKGDMEALFLRHEGYFGALGTLLECGSNGANVERILSGKWKNPS